MSPLEGDTMLLVTRSIELWMQALRDLPLGWTLTWLAATVVSTLAAVRAARRIFWESYFDRELWKRVKSLVQENRRSDAAALCEVEPGIFPVVYRAGLQSPCYSHLNSAHMMIAERAQWQRRRRNDLLWAAAFGLLAVGVLLWPWATDVRSTLRSMNIHSLTLVLWTAVLHTTLGAIVLAPAFMIIVAGVIRLRAVSSRLAVCALHLTSHLIEVYGAASLPQEPRTRTLEEMVPTLSIIRPRGAVANDVAAESGVWDNVSRRS